MNLEEIKAKVAEIKQKETELNISKQTLSILQPLYFEASQSVQEKVSSNSIGLIQQSVNEVTEAIKSKLDYTEIVNKLDRQISILEDSKDIEIMNELKSLVTNIKDLSTKSTFNNETLVRVFNESLNKISNLLISQKELPNSTEYKRLNGKITKVIEKYDKYTLNHSWAYNAQGDLIKVTTTKDEIA